MNSKPKFGADLTTLTIAVDDQVYEFKLGFGKLERISDFISVMKHSTSSSGELSTSSGENKLVIKTFNGVVALHILKNNKFTTRIILDDEGQENLSKALNQR